MVLFDFVFLFFVRQIEHAARLVCWVESSHSVCVLGTQQRRAVPNHEVDSHEAHRPQDKPDRGDKPFDDSEEHERAEELPSDGALFIEIIFYEYISDLFLIREVVEFLHLAFCKVNSVIRRMVPWAVPCWSATSCRGTGG